MRIYNSLTRQKEPLKEKKFGIYVCGPTVYDEPHIGHARSAYVFDMVVRYLRFKGLKVKFVRNITDIDDKIIDRARRELRVSLEEPSQRGQAELKDKVREIGERYLTRYHEDMKLLGLTQPDKEPKATETIEDMKKFIGVLINKGYGYESAGNVYFDVRKFKDYGNLSRQSLDQMEEGVGEAIDKNKKDPLDFALWKASKEDEPFWESPWGKGRPGWHIECSVMSTKFLGKDFLIHGGGLDLIFPHHENEIAQTVCAGKKCAKCWMHNGLLAVGGEKMSKSLGNFITIRDFQAKFRDLDLLKLTFLTSHYRHPVDYTQEKIEEMARMKERITIFLEKAADIEKINPSTALRIDAERSRSIKNVNQKSKINKLKKEFISAMDDDFNTPKALASIFELISLGYNSLAKNDFELAKGIKKLVRELCGVLGLGLEKAVVTKPALKKEIELLVRQRDIARRDKDFEKADAIRARLLSEHGVILEDTKKGTVWRRKI